MDEVLTIAEIEARFPDSWVFLDQPEHDEYGRVTRGRVVAVGPDRDEVHRQALSRPLSNHTASHCTKKWRRDVAYILSVWSARPRNLHSRKLGRPEEGPRPAVNP